MFKIPGSVETLRSFLVPDNYNNNPYGVFFQSTLMVYCIAFLNSIYLMITSLTMMTLIGSCVAYKHRQRGLTSCGLLRE